MEISNKNHSGVGWGEVYILPDSDFGFTDNHRISNAPKTATTRPTQVWFIGIK
jgi:hypothetical protein